MKKRVSQFDNDKHLATVATPTCSSCCCCLVSTTSASTILARKIHKETKEKKIKNPIPLITLSALFIPAIGFVVLGLQLLINDNDPIYSLLTRITKLITIT